MAKLKKVSQGVYVIVDDNGVIIGDVAKLRDRYFAKPLGEYLPTHSARTLTEIRQAIKEV